MADRPRTALHHLTLLVSLTLLATWAAAPIAAQVTPPVHPGFPNVTQTPGTVLSGLNAPEQGRTAIIAYHNGILFTVPELPSSAPDSDFQVRSWDLSDPANPVELATHGVSPMPINAHGYFKSGDYLVLGPNWPPEAPWTFLADGPGSVQRTTFPDHDGIGVRGNLFQPWFVGQTYWSYGEVAGDATLALDGTTLAQWDHLGLTGVVGHPFLLGDLLIFASDQSRTGVATYDVSDPTNPVLLDVLTTGGPGGYWPEIWGGDGKLYVVFPYRTNGNGFRVVDATDPTDLQFVTDKPLPGDSAMYAQFQDEYAFIGDHKIDLRTFESVLFLDGANTTRPNDGGVGISTSQFALPLGNLLVTGGLGDHQGMAIWAHQAEPDLRGPSVGYHVPRAGRTDYPTGAPISLLIHETLETTTLVNGVTFLVRPLGGSPVDGRITFSFDDVLTFTPSQPLLPDTTYEVVLPEGGIEDAAGNGMVGYSFTFSTGSSVGGNQPPTVDAFTASAYPSPPGQSLTLTAAATDPEGGAVEYRFDFGDGSPRTPWSATPSAGHLYPDPGHYRAVVQARDAAGAIASRRLTVTVLDPPAEPRPTRSSPIVCDAAGRRTWSVNPDNHTVTAVDSPAVDFEVPACADPRSLALSSQGEVWVACHDDDRLVVLGADGAQVAEIATGYGSAPVAVAPAPGGATLYAAFAGTGELRRYDAATRQLTGTVTVGDPASDASPRAIAVTGDGARILVTRFRSPEEHAEVWDVDAATFIVAGTFRIPKFGGEENRDTTASGRGVANYLVAIAVAPGDGDAWVVATKPNAERGLFFAQDLDQDNTVRNLALRLDLGAGTPGAGAFAGAVDLDNSDSASAVAFSPLGDYLFVTLQGNDEVIVLDALAVGGTSGLGSLVTRLGTGAAPQGVCVDPDTRRTSIKNLMGRSVTVLDTDPLFQSGDVSVGGTEVVTVGSELLPPQQLAGKRIFYHAGDPRMSAEGYLSCATCHLDGGHDGRVWDFTGRGEGFRNTTSLRGRAGIGQGNVHWSANFDEIQDFENDVRGAFGGTGFLDDADFAATADPLGPPKAGLSADLDALAAYVASLGAEDLPRSPHRAADGSLTPEAVAGRAVFSILACADCHAGADFTDSTGGPGVPPTLHDVGTIRTSSGGRLGGPLPGIDTPTLRGVWNTAPYFHDGSAATLGDVFRVAGGEILQAETGAVSGAAQVVDQFVDLNNDDTVHNRAYVEFSQAGGRLTFTGVDGGPGGTGALEIRYSTGNPRLLDVTVNGVPTQVTLEATGNDPSWRHTHWKRHRIENVPLTAGASNTVELSTPEQFPDVSVDDLLVTTAAELTRAQPHRQLLTLPPTDRDALLAYLRQLDGQPEDNPDPILFRDDFESGDTSAWSATVP